jgi:hypothetical protein
MYDRERVRRILVKAAKELDNQQFAERFGITPRRARVLRHRYLKPDPPLPYADTVDLVMGRYN